jgi:hypothetical protein
VSLNAPATRRRGGAGCLPGIIALVVAGIGIIVIVVAWFTSSAGDWGADPNRSFPTPGSATYQLSAGSYTLWRTGSTHVAPEDVTVRNVETGQRPAVTGTSGILGFTTGIGNSADIFGQVTLPTSGRWRFTALRNFGQEIALGPSKSTMTWIVIGAVIIAVAIILAVIGGIVWLVRRA